MKKAILPAVISALLATSAHAATVYDADGATLDLTGEADVTITNNDDGTVIGNDATIQLDWSNKLSESATVLGSIEVDVDSDGDFYPDDVWVGVSSDYGTFKAGETGSSYAIMEATAFYNEVYDLTDDLYNDGEGSGHAIRYQNTFGNVAFSANYSFEGDNSDKDGNFALSAEYSMDTFAIGVAYLDEGDDVKNLGVEATLNIDALTIAAIFSSTEESNSDDDYTLAAVSASYDIEDIATVYGSFQNQDGDNVDMTVYYAGVTKDVTPSLTTFIEYGATDDSSTTDDQVVAGVYYSF